uniref:EOG090X0DP2 n=1 Tax=Daphnia lumholtzi TaxID=42856 RepID=A0A4Y7MBM1_9CRUS|nr:EOG090X0DP2 [Daphnia lumholtzi]SVE77868.1 EOG090X0DP2 [Daphnia lumholtzi]SVE78498.1 EOG090X0DP2 [Daphnia lumholtzi]SVE79127.1 EOG090X0DP2 [Daphnia lumholtzi]
MQREGATGHGCVLKSIVFKCKPFLYLSKIDKTPLKELKIGQCRTGQHLRFLVCILIDLSDLLSSSLSGYRKVFEQYAAILEQKYPSLAIEGENHPPPFLNQKIAQFLGIVKMLLILLVVSGTNIFQHLGVQTPSVWEWTQQNKFYACLMTFFLCNAVEGQLISTGAFEITLNDVPLWSKLETGRIPQPPELFQMIDNHLSMATPKLHLDS